MSITLTFGNVGESRQCFYCKKSYKSGPTEHRILENKGHACPTCATRSGFSVDKELKPPANLADRKQLSTWLTDTLGIDGNSKVYRDLYAEHAGYLPEYNFLKSEPGPGSKAGIEKLKTDARKAEAEAIERERQERINAVDAKFQKSISELEKRLQTLREESGYPDEEDTPGPVLTNCKRDAKGKVVCKTHKV